MKDMKNNAALSLVEAPYEMIRQDEAAKVIAQIAEAVRGIADLVRVTSERMTSLEHEVKLLTKVTGTQATEISRCIRERAAALCAERKLPPQAQKPIANAIRREIKLSTGVDAVRDLPRCEYAVTVKRVQLWDDYRVIKAIRAKMEP